jgi:L-ascorbate metabolism protein UlaG (beta-lactamase superfamily)
MNGRIPTLAAALAFGLFLGVEPGQAQQDLQFQLPKPLTNREVWLQLAAPTGMTCRILTSLNLTQWSGMLTLSSVGMNQHTDSAAPYLDARFYRAMQVQESNALTGDHLFTDQGDVVIHPINHASFVMSWSNKMIYVDPVGSASLYAGLDRADLVLITHAHSDHYSATTLNAVTNVNCSLVAPSAVYSTMSTSLKALTTVLTNGASTTKMGIGIEAMPACNLVTTQHPRGVGNGYVLTIGGRRIYVCGDTEDIPEMRALTNIDLGFACINQPYTMTVSQAVSAVRAYRPRVIYPLHCRNADNSYSDLNAFKQQVGTDLGIEVRLRKWY